MLFRYIKLRIHASFQSSSTLLFLFHQSHWSANSKIYWFLFFGFPKVPNWYIVDQVKIKFHIYNTWSFIDKKRYITQLNRHLIVLIDEKEQLILVWFNITSLSKYLLFWWKIRQVFSIFTWSTMYQLGTFGKPKFPRKVVLRFFYDPLNLKI
jgi:hypothetical protein